MYTSWLVATLLLTLTAAWDPNYELVWEDNFDTLDLENNWDHEVTPWGGGVSKQGI